MSRMFKDPITFSEDGSIVERKVLSVAELNRRAKDLLEVHLPLLWVEGEVSNLSQPSSGHWYFTLKDERAQVRCAMFKGRNQTVKFTVKAGDKIVVRARVSLYEGRGDFQLIVEHMEEAGFGLLQKRFEELKNKLLAEGLFDDAHKKPIPAIPKHIGVITSPTGAAVRDVLAVLERRFPVIPVTVIPVAVQGDKASEELVNALEKAHRFGKCDVLILCRGGGSIEDLWAFNNEKLARAIYASDIPIVSAVGHEVDFTIADFVADVRAPTPSAAAELLSPNTDEMQVALSNYAQVLLSRLRQVIMRKKEKLAHIQARVKHPGDRLRNGYQRLDQLEIRLRNCSRAALLVQHNKLDGLRKRLDRVAPRYVIDEFRRELVQLNAQLRRAIKLQLKNLNKRLQQNAGLLDTVSPLATLKRGYSITQTENGKILRSAGETRTGEKLRIKLARGQLDAQVLSVEAEVGKE